MQTNVTQGRTGTLRTRVGIWVIATIMGTFAVPSTASAQIGIRGGISLTDFFGDGVDGTESVRNLSYGLSAALFNVGPVQIVAEGYYRKKGAGWNALAALQSGGSPVAFDTAQLGALLNGGPGNLSGQTLEFGLDYIEVPVLLRWNFPLLAQRFRPFLQGGPAFGWRLDCGVELDLAAGGGSALETACEDLTRDNLEQTLREYETGLVLGAGVAMSVLGGAGSFVLDARLTRGLSRLNQGSDGPDVRNQAFSVLLGYTFGFY